MTMPRKNPWAGIDVLPQSIIQSCGIVTIAECEGSGGPEVRVFVRQGNAEHAQQNLPGTFNGFPVWIIESGPNVPTSELEGLRQIRHYTTMADIPAAPPPQAPPPQAGRSDLQLPLVQRQVTGQQGTVPGAASDASGTTQAGQDFYSSLSSAASDVAASASSTLSSATNATDALQSAYQSQNQALQNYLAQQRALAQGSASSAGQQAAGAASNLGAIVLLSAVGIALVIWFSRK